MNLGLKLEIGWISSCAQRVSRNCYKARMTTSIRNQGV
ncbi:hypothetical protein ASZ90_012458 [hydrocarbon metagenome]|uniref:Uncharacterized protein n=1 Tax=hydrocarbon metagenome TaxID=938273 RepID=A0A0W8FAC3_9ZZZZ